MKMRGLPEIFCYLCAGMFLSLKEDPESYFQHSSPKKERKKSTNTFIYIITCTITLDTTFLKNIST